MDSGVFGSRVGAAAFAVGLGLVVATSPGTAVADDSFSDSSQGSDSASTPGPSASPDSPPSTSSTATESYSDTDDESAVTDEESAGSLTDTESELNAESDFEVTPSDVEPSGDVESGSADEVAAESADDPEPAPAESDFSSQADSSQDAAVPAKSWANGDDRASRFDAAEADSSAHEDGPADGRSDDVATDTPVDLPDPVELSAQTESVEAIIAPAHLESSQEQVTVAPASQTPVAETQPTGIVSGFLELVGFTPSAAGTDGPMTPSVVMTAMLDVIRREKDRLPKGQAPMAAAAQTALTDADSGPANAAEVTTTATAPQAVSLMAAATAMEGGGINSGNPGDELWGEAHFAPYVDMAGWPPPDLVQIAQDRGVSLLNLGFLQATSDGRAAWGGYSTLTPGSSDSQAQTIDASIAALKAAGGDVMISLGGASGTSLAQSHVQRGLGEQDLADAYVGVVDAYSLNRIDFDIEGAAVAEPASIALRSEAIALLQQARPEVEVWYTLPVLPTGLTHDGLNVVDSALAAGVVLDGVNVMAMDFGESAAPTSGPNAKTMGAYAIESAESTHAQLASLFAQHGQEFGWNQLGVTPMIGVNDVTTEVFTVADAQALEDFARANGLGMVSMWSVSRDTPGTLGQASPKASGINVAAGSFSNVWNDYGTVNAMNFSGDTGDTGTGDTDTGDTEDPGNQGGGGGTPVEGGTTTVIGWHWGTDTVLDFDPAADKLDFGWFQPGNFDVTEQSGSTQIAIVGNNQTYTLDGVALGEMQTGNIIALDSNTVAKWATLIEGAGPTPEPELPSVSIGDAAGAEGNNGTSNLGFTVSLSEASNAAVTVGYSTANGTAASADYVAQSGTVTFIPGLTSQLVNIGVVGDTTVEADETFTITLANPTGATLGDAIATGTITNDDAATQPGGPSVPFGSHSKDYAPGMLSPTGSQEALDSVAIALYNTWKSNFLVSAGDSQLAVRSDDADHPYVAEAQGYGMELAALMAGADPDAQSSFDGILTYVLAHPSSVNPDLHAAEQNNDFVSVNGGDSATDGDIAIAYALLLADEQWGNEGTYDYKQLAVTRIDAIKASEMNPNTYLPTLGDWDTPGGSYYNSTRPSDLMIDHFREFGAATNDPFWDSAVTNAQNLLTQQQDTYAPSTGLIADFVVNTNTTPMPAPANFLEGPTDGQYSYNSVRVPWHLGTDAVVYGDATSIAQAEKITSWFRTKTGDDPSKVVSGYTLDGTATVTYLDPAFVATLGPAAMSDPANQAWLDSIWNYAVAESQTSAVNSYYDASLMLQSMIVMSGNYWAPGTITNDDTEDPGNQDPGTGDPGAGDSDSASVSFVKSGDWSSGFNGDVTVANTGTSELSDWQVAFDFDGDISSIWNASIVSQTDNRYVVQGVDWNSDIASGASTSFGFTATAGSVTNLALNGAAIPGGEDPAVGATPLLSVSNTSVQEGDSGTADLVFDVSLSAPADDVVTVSYRTEDLTAAAGSDYEAIEGTLTFAAGETSKQVNVAVLGDTVYEGNESLLLVLSGITGAEFDESQAAGLISNDDANPNGTVDPEYRVVGYFTEWAIYGRGFDVADIPADKLTHVNYAFADINDAGEVVLFDSFAAVEKTYPGDTWDQPVKGNFNQLAKLKEENPDLEVLISIGGWTLSEDFSDVAATQDAREKFAASAVDFITAYGFDGIDLDWEYPVSGGESDNAYRPEDGANYVLLVEEIRKQLDALEATDGIDDKDYLLTIASPAGYDKVENYDLAGMAPYLDWFQVMAYDYYGAGWSNETGHLAGLYANPGASDPLYNTDYAVSLYLEHVDPSKIVLGAPLYGHSWKGVPDGGDGGLDGRGTGAGVGSYGDRNGNISYLHIVELLEENPDLYQVYWDDQAKASYIYGASDGTFISYESPEALQYRLDYIKDLGLGGIMFWEIDDDIRDSDDPRSLIGLAASELLGGAGDPIHS